MSQHTDTSKNTKAWGCVTDTLTPARPDLCHSTLTPAKYMKACSVSQHTNTSKYTKATLKWCCSPHIYMAIIFSDDKPLCVTASILQKWRLILRRRSMAAQVEGLEERKGGGGRLRGWGWGGGVSDTQSFHPMECTCQFAVYNYRLPGVQQSCHLGTAATTAKTTAEIQRAHRLHRQHKKQSNVMLSGEIQFKEAGSLLAQPLDATQSEGR